MSWFLAVLITILLLCALGWMFYWAVMRPVILDSLETRLAQLRSEVDWAIIEGREGSGTRAAGELVSALGEGEHFGSLSVSSVLYWHRRARVEMKSRVAQEHEIYKGSAEWIQKARFQHGILVFAAVLLNSPVWWPVVAGVLICAYFSRKVDEFVNETRESATIMREKHC